MPEVPLIQMPLSPVLSRWTAPSEIRVTRIGRDPSRRVIFQFLRKPSLGERLRTIRRRIEDSGVELLDWDGVLREVRERRGGSGLYEDDDD